MQSTAKDSYFLRRLKALFSFPGPLPSLHPGFHKLYFLYKVPNKCENVRSWPSIRTKKSTLHHTTRLVILDIENTITFQWVCAEQLLPTFLLSIATYFNSKSSYLYVGSASSLISRVLSSFFIVTHLHLTTTLWYCFFSPFCKLARSIELGCKLLGSLDLCSKPLAPSI